MLKDAIKSVWENWGGLGSLLVALPFPMPESQYRKRFVTLVCLFEPRKESVSKGKNHCVASKSNQINLRFNSPP